MEYIKPNKMNFHDMEKYSKAVQEHMYTCKCGHRVLIRKNEVRSTCTWCGGTVYRNAREEFIDRLETKLYGRTKKRKDTR